MASSVLSSIHFLQRDPLYDSEKVFELKFDPPSGLPKSNMRLEKRDGIKIHDIRDQEAQYSFTRNGFSIMRADFGMPAKAFYEEHLLRQKYFPKLAHTVKEHLGASQVRIFDYNVSDEDNSEHIRLINFFDPKTRRTISNQHWRLLQI
jgi:hypothetical protein